MTNVITNVMTNVITNVMTIQKCNYKLKNENVMTNVITNVMTIQKCNYKCNDKCNYKLKNRGQNRLKTGIFASSGQKPTFFKFMLQISVVIVKDNTVVAF